MVVFKIAEMVLVEVLWSFSNASMRTLDAHDTSFAHFCHCHCLQSVIANKTVQGFQFSSINLLFLGQSVVVSHLPRVGSMSPYFLLL